MASHTESDHFHSLAQTPLAATFEALNHLDLPAIGYLLGGEYPIVWANAAAAAEDGVQAFLQRFPTLAAYGQACPDAFAALKRSWAEARAQDDATTVCTFRDPQKEGRWQRMTSTMTTQRLDGLPVCYALLTDVSDLVSENQAQARLHEQKTQYFRWMMDEYVGNVYISDMETYELLYSIRLPIRPWACCPRTFWAENAMRSFRDARLPARFAPIIC